MKRLVALALSVSLLFAGCGKKSGATFNGKSAEDWAASLEPGNKSQTKLDAIGALYEMAEKGNDLDAVKFLAIGVEDSAMEVRITAIKFLGNLGPKAVDALPVLKKAKEANLEKDPPTALAADTAITLIDPKGESAPAAKEAKPESKPEEKPAEKAEAK